MTTDDDPLKTFARHVIRECCWEACECGSELQEIAEQLGLIVPVPGGYDPKVHGEHDYAEPGDPYYVFAPMLKERKPASDEDTGSKS